MCASVQALSPVGRLSQSSNRGICRKIARPGAKGWGVRRPHAAANQKRLFVKGRRSREAIEEEKRGREHSSILACTIIIETKPDLSVVLCETAM